MIHCSPSYFKYKSMLLIVWSQAMQPMQMLPRTENWGWSKKIEITWMTLPEAAKALSILKHCSCKRGCKGRRICRKIELPCTELFECSGKCSPWSVFIWSIRSDNKHYILVWYIVCYDMISVYWTLEVLGEF